ETKQHAVEDALAVGPDAGGEDFPIAQHDNAVQLADDRIKRERPVAVKRGIQVPVGGESDDLGVAGVAAGRRVDEIGSIAGDEDLPVRLERERPRLLDNPTAYLM